LARGWGAYIQVSDLRAIMALLFLSKRDERYINNVKRKKERKKKLTLLWIEPTALNFNAVNSSFSLFEYSSKRNALEW
jgi:hypothetical protein